jgi:HK97 family phage prohead protease
MKKEIQRRIIDAEMSTRSNDDGTVGLRGYASVFDQVAHGETVKRHAFTRTLKNRDDVKLLVDHTGVPLASTRAGTMTVGVDDRGLWFDAPSLDTANPAAAALISAVSRGDMHQCSFAGYFHDTPVVDGVREVREVELLDVSAVTYPWYSETTVTVTGNRNADRALCLRTAPGDRAAYIQQVMRAAPPGKTSYGDLAESLAEALGIMLGDPIGGVLVEDMGDDYAVYCMFHTDDYDMYQIGYTVDTAGVFTFDTPFMVEAVTEYRPITPAEQVEETLDETMTTATPMRSYSIAEARALFAPLVAV